MPAACSVPGCIRIAEAHGWCHGHLQRFLRKGDVEADRPLGRRVNGICEAPGCDRPALAKQLCRTHRNRQVRHGGVRSEKKIKTTKGGSGYVSHGYRIVPVPLNERHLSNGEHSIAEHRLVMARHLGRALASTESVHHLNGQRLDNRIQNLELWSRWQPTGQRVEDKIAFAVEILLTYAPALLPNFW